MYRDPILFVKCPFILVILVVQEKLTEHLIVCTSIPGGMLSSRFRYTITKTIKIRGDSMLTTPFISLTSQNSSPCIVLIPGRDNGTLRHNQCWDQSQNGGKKQQSLISLEWFRTIMTLFLGRAVRGSTRDAVEMLSLGAGWPFKNISIAS